MNLLLHSETKQQLDKFIANPSQAILLQGSSGSGKTTIINWIVTQLLANGNESIKNHPYFLTISPDKKLSISINKIREINHFLSIKVPTNKLGINRVVAIENAEYMSEEAQNALLKNLEEPPQNTLFLISTSEDNSLLPTIKSRLNIIRIIRPSIDELKSYLINSKIDEKNIDLAILISGGLPGLALAITRDYDNHPLVKAAQIARVLLISNNYKRLLKINEIYKDRELSLDVLTVLQHMATIALETASKEQAIRWKKILNQTYATKEYLLHRSNAKLALTDLILNL
jgi:DNA polymerase-3 subunit delta'